MRTEHQMARAAEHWRLYLGIELRCPVTVVFTRARRTPIQVKRAVGQRGQPVQLDVRMHAMFAAAPTEVMRAAASWIRSGKRAPRACAALDAWIVQALATLPLPKRVAKAEPRGHAHDLATLARSLCANELRVEFPNTRKLPAIGWGRRGASRTRHSLRLGSFDPDTKFIRLHAVLDQATVPEFFVRFVLFHELLHAVYPPRRDRDDRWVHHGREFRRREAAYGDFERALEWEKRNIRALIRAARRGDGFVPVAESEPMQRRGLAAAAKTGAGSANMSAAPLNAALGSAENVVPVRSDAGHAGDSDSDSDLDIDIDGQDLCDAIDGAPRRPHAGRPQKNKPKPARHKPLPHTPRPPRPSEVAKALAHEYRQRDLFPENYE